MRKMTQVNKQKRDGELVGISIVRPVRETLHHFVFNSSFELKLEMIVNEFD